MHDPAVSAFRGKNAKKGALREFLAAVEEGRVPPGSVLIVESLDRLSRATAIEAQAQLAQIVGAGVKVVTAADGREYDAESLEREPMGLIYSLLVMIRAFEESNTKSGRVKDAIRRKAKGWLEGKYKGRVGSEQTDPAWVRWDEDAQRFEFDEPRAEAIRRMVHYYRQGYGAIRIPELLAKEGLKISESHATNRVRQIMNSPALMGTKTIKVDDETFPLSGYFPAILTPEEFEELQLLASKRGIRQGKGEIPALVTGQKLSYCGHCSSLLSTQNLRRERKRADAQADGPAFQRRLRCNRRFFHGEHCKGGDSCLIEPIEKALLAYCSDQFNLDALLKGSNEPDPAAKALVVARKRLTSTEAKLAKIERALLADDGDAPETFVKLARSLEAEKREHQREVEKLEREAGVESRAKPAPASAWAKLKEDALALDYDARMAVRKLVGETFSRIAVSMKGFKGNDENAIGLVLVGKRGVGRKFVIDRLSGELLGDIEEVDINNLRTPLSHRAKAPASTGLQKPETRASKAPAEAPAPVTRAAGTRRRVA
jgi:DNA invertase Pin-like site-specific DNA recombinase